MGSADPDDHASLVAFIRARDKWFALAAGERVPVGARWGVLSVVDLGELNLPSGELGACDPYVFLDGCEAWLTLPPGRYPVKVSVADLSPQQDGSDRVEAYVTLLVDPDAEEARQETLQGSDWGGVGVDAGTVCFVDADAARRAFEVVHDWEAVVEGPNGWFERMNDPNHLGSGFANVLLPGLTDGSNLVMCHSGWGDGIYPVVVGYDEKGRVVRVHIDLGVIGAPRQAPTPAAPPPAPTEAMKLKAVALMSIGSFVLMAVGLALRWPVELIVGAVLAWTALAYGVWYWSLKRRH